MDGCGNKCSMNELEDKVSRKEAILIKAGATREAGAKVIAEAMSAYKMTLDKHGDEHHEPDWAIRLRAEELRARETGDIKPDSVSGPTAVQINLGNINNEVVAELMKMAEDVKGQLAALRSSGKQTGQIIDIDVSRGTTSG